MIGTKLADRFEIVSEIGRGGMGVVYRARDPLLNREVAIKVISPSQLTPETEQRFQSEAQVVARMDHPSIVTIHDFGRHEGSLFFVMPVVPGVTVRQLIRDRSLLLGEIVDIGISVADALDYSHARDVIHRDIKPENIMALREDGAISRVRVMDFGLARGSDVTRITKTGVLVGTMTYLSPEQVLGKPPDGRSDIYALGCVLYECVLNEVPFAGEMQSVLYRIVHDLPQSPRDLGVEIDPEFESLILDSLAKDPAQRPQHAGELAKGLRAYRSRLRDSERNKSVLMTRTMQMPRPTQSPFVGREEELKELQTRLNAAVRGECQFVTVSGDAGAGKTRLLDELEKLCQARKVRVLHGRFVEQEGSFPYYGFCEAIQEYFRSKEGASSPTAMPDFSDLADDLVSLFPMLSEVDTIAASTSRRSDITRPDDERSPDNRSQIFELLARTIIRLSEGEPLVLLCEDLHMAEASLEALQYIVRRLAPTPTLVIGTFRSTEVDRRHALPRMLGGFRGDRRFASVELGPLTPSQHRQFLATLVGGTAVVDELAERIFEGTEGNPFFTKELVRSLLDSGSIVRGDSGAWALSEGRAISPDALPATIQQAVEERVERLPDLLHEILSVASVMGRTFEFRDLEKLAGDVDDLDEAVDQLVQQGLVEEDHRSRGDRLMFSSGVVREVLYAGLSRRKRRSLHRRFAGHLEKQHAGRLEGLYPQLVYHFSEGDVPEKAVEYGLRHARKSLEAFSADEAVRAARTALEFLDAEWEGERILEGDAHMLLASGLQMSGAPAAALKEIASAIKVFEEEGRAARAVEALLAGARIAWEARQIDETSQWVERGMQAARSAEDHDTLRELLSLAATLANLRGEYGKAAGFLQEVDELRPETAGAVAEAIPTGGRLVVALANPVPAEEPVDITFLEETEVFRNVYQTLLSTDQDGNLVPLLCERWEGRDEGRVFRLSLAPEARFHDGAALTAEDVKRSFERAARRAAGNLPPAIAPIRGADELAAARADGLAGIVVQAINQLEIQLREPLPIYPALLTDRRTAIGRATEENGSVRLVGTGPFRLASHDREKAVLERNEHYWRGRPPNVDAVEFRLGLSASSIAASLRSGEVDLGRDLLPEDLEEILRDPRFRNGVVETPQKFTYFVLFNTRGGTLAELPARRALAGVVRPQDLVWQNLGRFAEPAMGLLPPGILGHDPGRRKALLSEDEARKELAAAGLQAPVRLRAAVHPLIQDRYGRLLDALLAGWKALGVEVSLITPDMDSYLRAWDDSDGIDLAIVRWGPDYDDPDNFTHSLFHSEAGELRAYFSSEEADRTLHEARAEGRPAAREVLYRRFESWLLEEGIVVPLFHDVDYRVGGPRVRGLQLTSIPPYVNYAELGKAESVAKVDEVAREAGGALHVPMAGALTTLDPSENNTAEQAEVLPSVFETLLRAVGDAQIAPWLASEFHAEEGGRRYRFRLREDVRFHDGRRLTARDVRYSFERLLGNPDAESRWKYSMIRGAKEILDGKSRHLTGFQIYSTTEFTIELEGAVSFFPALVCFPASAIVPEGTSRFGGSWKEGAVGTGPFRVTRFQPGERIELERNPTYWRRGYPRSESLTFRFGVAPREILSGYRQGRYSVAADLFPDDVEALRRDATLAPQYREAPRLCTYFVTFNIHRLEDRDLRRRLAGAVDIPALVRAALGRLAMPAHGLIPPGLLGYEPLRASDRRGAPPPESRRERIELTAAVHPILLGEYGALFEQLTQAYRDAGIHIRPVSRTMEEYVEMEMKRSVDLSVGRWIADYPDSDTFVHILHSKEGDVGQMCGTAEIDALIDGGRLETDPAARHAIYRQIESGLRREALLLPLFHEQVYRFARPDVEGFSVSLLYPVVDYAELRLRPR